MTVFQPATHIVALWASATPTWFVVSIVSNVLFPHNYHEEEKEEERGKEREGQPYTSLTTKRKATFLFFSGHSFHTTVTAKSFVTNSKMF